MSLSESEWQAFVARHPEPVEWLREQILAQLDGLPEPASPRRGVRGEGTSRPWSSHRV